LGSNVNILSKELYDLLDLDKKLEKCDIDLLLANDYYGHEEQYLKFYNPCRPFLRTTGTVTDSKEGCWGYTK
jgi:hypothetical protein